MSEPNKGPCGQTGDLSAEAYRDANERYSHEYVESVVAQAEVQGVARQGILRFFQRGAVSYDDLRFFHDLTVQRGDLNPDYNIAREIDNVATRIDVVCGLVSVEPVQVREF